MYTGRTIFSQLMDMLPWRRFQTCISRYSGNYKVKAFTCSDQYRVMAFAQLTYRESLRDIEACLRAMNSRLYHMGIRSTISRNTLAHANETRDWRIYADFTQILIDHARRLYTREPFGVELDQAVYALDSTTIDLCLSVFPWAHFRKRKGAIKLHTLLDLHGNIPVLAIITHGKVHDVNIIDSLLLEAGALYIMDRAYTDFDRLHRIHTANAFFITRTKKNLQFKRVYSHAVDKSTGLKCDQTIVLKGYYTKQKYSDKLRRIRFYDSEKEKHLVFLTNNFDLPAATITELYRCRWQIELFFKWIKQHLRIKSFYGTSENAVKSQIWIAISVYVLVAIMRKELKIDLSLYTILQIFSVSLFEKGDIYQLLTESHDTDVIYENPNQLKLFD
jgi:transposase